MARLLLRARHHLDLTPPASSIPAPLARAGAAIAALGFAVAAAARVVGASLTPVAASVVALYLATAAALLLRCPATTALTGQGVARVAPSLTLSAVMIAMAPAPHLWPPIAVAILAGGTALTVTSLWSLRRSFGILPAVRGLVDRGSYAVIRHPAYAGELLMLASIVAAALWVGRPAHLAASIAVLALTVTTCAWRIQGEETVLATDPDWAAYRDRVRWRLVPKVW